MATAHANDGLFPLRLTAIERFMIADDCRIRPMTFSIETVLSGDFRHADARSALQQAVKRHPLLSATITRIRGRRHWVKNTQPVEYQADKTPAQDQATLSRYIDLNSRSGLRVLVSSEDEMTRVSFLFHHAVTDGIGAMRFIGDFLGTYGELTAESDADSPQLSTLSSADLRLRGQLRSPDSVSRGSLKRAFAEFIEFARCWPLGIIAGGQSRKHASHRVPFITRKLQRKSLRELKQAAMKHRVNPNDVSLACLFSTINTWNTLLEPSRRMSEYRIAIPASLRTAEHDQMPAANAFGFVFVQGSSSESLSPTNLARKINRQLPQRLENRVAARVVDNLGKAPGGTKLLTYLPMRLCTAVLAHVGDIKRHLNCRFPVHRGKFVAGSVVLEGLFGAPPVRKGTPVAISIGSYAGELLLNFNCDPQCFANDQAEQFADLFMQKLAHLVAGLNQELLKWP